MNNIKMLLFKSNISTYQLDALLTLLLRKRVVKGEINSITKATTKFI